MAAYGKSLSGKRDEILVRLRKFSRTNIFTRWIFLPDEYYQIIEISRIDEIDESGKSLKVAFHLQIHFESQIFEFYLQSSKTEVKFFVGEKLQNFG